MLETSLCSQNHSHWCSW